MARQTTDLFLDKSKSTEVIEGFVRMGIEVGIVTTVVIACSQDHASLVNACGGRFGSR